MELEFRKFDPSLSLEAQRELFKDCFPENNGSSVESIDHYKWKFQSYPNAPHSYEYGAWDKASEKLVGYYAAIPYRYQIEKDLMTSGMVCDVMTHSLTRGQGVFTKLGKFSTTELGNSGLDFTIGYPIRKEVIPGHLKVGWKIAFELPLYLKVLKSKTLLTKFHLGALSPFVDLGLYLLRLLTGSYFVNTKDLNVKTLSPEEFLKVHEQSYKVFFDKWKCDKPFYLIKDRDFLKWRLSAPDTNYKIVTLFLKDELIALSITRGTKLESVPSLAILDLMILDDQKCYLGYLYKTLEQIALKDNLETLATMASKSWANYYRFLRFGFLKAPQTFKLIIKPLSDRANAAPLFNEKNWHLMWIDSDDL